MQEVDRPRPTMRDVAALAGVSLKTVSRVINGETTVAEDLADRVRRAANQLEYQPNLAASSLRRSDGKTRTIGVLLEDVSNPFSAALHRAIGDVARSHGFSVLAGSVDEEHESERQLVLSLVARRVDGLIIVPAVGPQSYLLNQLRSGMRVVFVDRPPRHLDADAVVSTNRTGAAEGTAHLIGHGHRRIGYLGDLRAIATADQRYEGFLDAHREAGIPVDERLVHFDIRTSESASECVMELLAGPSAPGAFFTSQNLLTIGAIRALRASGAQHRVALVGFDDIPLADLLDPPLTVIAQDPARLGAVAAELLFRRIDGDNSPSRLHEIPTRLIVRASGEIPPIVVRRTSRGGLRTRGGSREPS
jgi:LacI family transcriptional regulator